MASSHAPARTSPDRSRALWRCPRCGHRFVSKNLAHSCVRVPIHAHFRGRAAARYPTYRAWAAAARACGPVTIYAQKTRIVFQARVRFGGAVVRAGFVDAGLWMKRRVSHPLLHRTESLGPMGFILRFRLTGPEDIDDGLRSLVREAYQLALAGPQKVASRD